MHRGATPPAAAAYCIAYVHLDLDLQAHAYVQLYWLGDAQVEFEMHLHVNKWALEFVWQLEMGACCGELRELHFWPIGGANV